MSELDLSLPALSIKQPWAWLVVRPDLTDDYKRITLCKHLENRWTHWKFRGPFLIHASLGMTRKYHADVQDFLRYRFGDQIKVPAFDSPDLQRGGIIGRAVIADCDKWPGNPWWMEPQWGYRLCDIQPLPFHPCKGMLGFFKVK